MRWLMLVYATQAGCLLGVEYDKIEPSTFCSGEPPELETPASCKSASVPLCGPSSDNCCSAPPIPCGNFSRDYDGAEFDDDSRTATLSDYRLELYEVTVARFRAFVEAGGGTAESPPAEGSGAHPGFANSGWQKSYDTALLPDRAALVAALVGQNADDCHPESASYDEVSSDRDLLPINCVSWYEAFAFCAWDGARLPSEAEWNYAAAGGGEQRVFPWETPAEDYNVGLAVYGCNALPCPGDTGIARVGSRPDGVGRFGHFDLSGNVAEWLRDHIGNLSNYRLPCQDCVEIAGDTPRGRRGGAFDSRPDQEPFNELKVSYRSRLAPETRDDSMGIRCARSLP